LFSDPLNWKNANTQQNGVPQAGDDVFFTQGSNLQAFVDPAFTPGGSLGRLEIDTGHTASIILQQNLSVTTTLQEDGAITGSADYKIPSGGASTWVSGQILGNGGVNATTTISAGATFTVSQVPAGQHLLKGRNLINNGEISWTGDPNNPDSLVLASNATIQNTANSVFALVSQGMYLIHTADGTGLFQLDGAATTGLGALIIDAVTSSAGSWSGALGGNVTFDADTTFNGAILKGGASFNLFTSTHLSGSLTIDVNTTAEATSGTIDGAGSLEIAGQLTANNETFQGAALVHVAGGGTLQLSGPKTTINGRTIKNDGTMNWGSGDLLFGANGGQITNNGTLSITIQASQSIAGPGTVVNAGTMNVSIPDGTTATINSSFSNTGSATIDVKSGTLAISQAVTIGSNQRLILEGTANFTASGTLTIASGGEMDAQGTNTVTASTLTNSGILNLEYGPPFPTLDLNGNFVQTASGTLQINFDGGSLNCSTLNITGSATLGGTLYVFLTNPPDNAISVVFLNSSGILSDTWSLSTNIMNGALHSGTAGNSATLTYRLK
jgi:hypothetical protein